MKSTVGINTEEKPSQFISYGVQKLKIVSIDTLVAKNGSGRKIYQLNMETPSIQGFEGFEGATGKVGRVKFPNKYILESEDTDVDDLVKAIGIMTDKFGTRKELEALDVSKMNMEEYAIAISPFVTNKYAFFKVCTEQYVNNKGKVANSLRLAKFGFIASLEEGIDHLKFDMSSSYDFKAPEGNGVPDSTPVDKKKREKLPF